MPDTKDMKYQPKVTFLVSDFDSKKSDLFETLNSIQNLVGDNWEATVITDRDQDVPGLSANLKSDARISFLALNDLNFDDAINGEFVVFCKAGDRFNKGLLQYFYASLSEDEPADWVYYDCEFINIKTNEASPLFKPPSLSPSMLLSVNYLSRGFVRASFVKESFTKYRSNQRPLAVEYALALKLHETNRKVRHIPNLLVNQIGLSSPVTSEISTIIGGYLSDLGLENVSAQSSTYGIRFTWRNKNSSVAVVIPTKNNRNLLEPWIDSLLTKTSYTNFKIHLVDNNSDEIETLNYYDQIESNPKVQIHPYHQEFNYSEANNLGAAGSDSDLLLFLNDDMAVIDPEWLTELVQWAERPEIGIVGTKLIRANRTIQHAGIIMGLNGFAGHIYLNTPEHYHGLFGSVDWYRDYLAVTGACQMMRRGIFNDIGGFDNGFKLAFGDIDICLRIHKKGYRIVYTPYASLFHYEGQSRGYTTPPEDIIRSYQKMESALSKHDPYFSPNLTPARIPKCAVNNSGNNREEQFKTRKKFYSKQ
ncbi:MAG: glycosyltransferase family 2 protein [Brevefilum sp.]|nr:glycosyltransferase family 2 protein [Brevefilum sp.]